MTMPSWAREPLIHFLALGAVLYVALTWGGTPPDPTSRLISVGHAEREKIAESWTLTMGRAPTDAELDTAVDAYVREEVLYREALRLGLDEDDAIVRRRMVSKMDLSASLAAEIADPDDSVLRAYMDANADRYVQQETENAKVSFDQTFFESEARARAAMGQDDPQGDATSLPASLESMSMRDVTARFGQQFVEGLRALEPGDEWQGPMPSGFGWHLVRLKQRETSALDFASLRGALANDWRADQIAARKQRAFDVLASAYRIDIAE